MSTAKLDLSAHQPYWLTRLAAEHYSESERQSVKPQRRAWHRRQWLDYTMQALPVLGLERFLEVFQWHCNYDSWNIGEGEAVIKALAATVPAEGTAV